MPAFSQQPEESEPFVVSADELVVDDELNLVIARGNVQIAQAGRVLTADTVTYNPRNGIVTASGNVVAVEPSGEVIYSEYAELDSDLAEGFVEGIGLLFADESRLAAEGGIRRGEITEVDRAIYSPCELCEDDPDRAPLWQLRARRVIHDGENKDVIYRDTFLEFGGVPVLYSPYFRHPDPTVDRRSGLLIPNIGSTSDLGFFLRGEYYWAIAPNRDATFELMPTAKSGVKLGGEYRHRFDNGILFLDTSLNQSDRTELENGVEVVEQNALRGHIFADTEFHLDENWRVGADIERASDDTYLDQFEISGADVLTSEAYAEGFYGLNYAAAKSFVYQDLRRPRIDQPLILPDLAYNHVSEPGSLWGGQWFANLGALNIERQDLTGPRITETEGVDTSRLSAETGWRTDFTTGWGLVTNFRTAVRGDFYLSDNLPDPSDPTVTRDQVSEFRIFPRATLTTSYPLVNQEGTVQQLFEPIVAVTAAPDLGDVSNIPNNDSVDVEFDEINLFSDSRFPGIDRVEDGARVTYGLRLAVFGFGGGSTSIFGGQSFNFYGENPFPDGSGLEDRQSDLVGRITITPAPAFNLDYRFRFDPKSFDGRRQEVSLLAGPDLFRFGANYTFVDAIAGTGTGEDVEEVTLRASSRFAENWAISALARRDLDASEMRKITLGLAYSDECFTFGIDFRRDFTEGARSPGDSVFLFISLRNLGDLPFAVERGTLFD